MGFAQDGHAGGDVARDDQILAFRPGRLVAHLFDHRGRGRGFGPAGEAYGGLLVHPHRIATQVERRRGERSGAAAIGDQRLGHDGGPPARLEDADPEVEILAGRQRLVEAFHRGERLAADQAGDEDVDPPCNHRVERRLALLRQELGEAPPLACELAGEDRIAGDQPDRRIGVDRRDHRREIAVAIDVVAIEQRDQRSTGRRDRMVARRRHAAMRGGEEADARIGGGERRNRAGDIVRRAVVDDDRFPVCKVLRLQRCQRLAHEVRRAPSGDDHGHGRRSVRHGYESP